MFAIENSATEVARRQRLRRRSERSIWGLPWYDISLGPDPDTGELKGSARGVIAIGDSATGVVAIGTNARGFVAVGLFALGVFSFGVISIGVFSFGAIAVSLLFSLGAIGIGGFAVAALAVGGIATGPLAFGYIADGVITVGHFSYGLHAYGTYVADAGFVYGVEPLPGTDPEAVRYLENHPGLRSLLVGVLKYAFLLNVLNLVWITPLVQGLWRQRRRGWIFPKPTEGNVLFSGNGGGRSYKSLYTRCHSASSALKLLVTKDQLWVWVPRHFPFTGAGVNYDLEHLIPASVITRVVHNDSMFIVVFSVEGEERTLELWPHEPEPFLDAITALSA